jgi:hypothetical protein
LHVLDWADSLDTIELIVELEEEFGKDTVRWALRYVEALVERPEVVRRLKPGMGPEPGGPDPLWDRDLDG